jgi:hypothetical protein
MFFVFHYALSLFEVLHNHLIVVGWFYSQCMGTVRSSLHKLCGCSLCAMNILALKMI